MKNSVKPLVILFGYRSSKDKLTFLGRAGFIEIIGNTGSIQKILRHCYGFNTVSEIKVLTKLESPLFEQLLNICERNGLVADSRSLFRIFHVDSANPPAFFTDISPKMVAAKLREKANGESFIRSSSRSPGQFQNPGFSTFH